MLQRPEGSASLGIMGRSRVEACTKELYVKANTGIESTVTILKVDNLHCIDINHHKTLGIGEAWRKAIVIRGMS